MNTPASNTRWFPLALVALLLAACSGESSLGDGSDQGTEPLSIAHTFDFASKAPARLSIMFSMAWFGIQDNVGDASLEPQSPPGKDPIYQNWKAGGTPCALVTPDPTKSDTCIHMGANNVCKDHEPNGVAQRRISSRRRPLTGIWSSTGLDTESQRKLDLMLSMVRRPGCRADDGAKLDAWTMQNNSIKFSSKYVTNPHAAADLPYRTMMALFARADLAGIPNVVMPGFDETWYANFGTSVGLGKCDDSPGNPHANCVTAYEEDLRDLVIESTKHTSSVKVAGKPVIFIYTDSHDANTPRYTEYRDTILPWVRSHAGTDFYVVGVDTDPNYFQAFDALAPWLSSSSYKNLSGTSVYSDAYTHTMNRHAKLIEAVGAYPGRLVFGGVTPGFDDWTRNWSGPCQERQMPTDSPRDPSMLTAQADFFSSCKRGAGCIASPSIPKYDFRGFVGETWDDWTEGSEFEPDVYEGPDRLVRLRQLFGKVFGDAPDAAGDAELAARWTSYGQARNGKGGAAGIPPVTDLSCDGEGPPPADAIDVSSPPNDSVQAGRIRVVADDDSTPVADELQVYVDDVLAATQKGGSIDVEVPTSGAPLSPGVHRVGVKGWYAGVSGPVTQHFVTVTSASVAEIFPSEGDLTASAVHVLGRDNLDGKAASAMQVYLDGVLATAIDAPANELLDFNLSMLGAGSHKVAVKSWYGDGSSLFTEHGITVSSAAVVQSHPADGASVHSPVFVQATDNSSKGATSMQVYLDDVMVRAVHGIEQLEVHVPAGSGSHRVSVKSWYADGTSNLSEEAVIIVE